MKKITALFLFVYSTVVVGYSDHSEKIKDDINRITLSILANNVKESTLLMDVLSKEIKELSFDESEWDEFASICLNAQFISKESDKISGSYAEWPHFLPREYAEYFEIEDAYDLIVLKKMGKTNGVYTAESMQILRKSLTSIFFKKMKNISFAMYRVLDRLDRTEDFRKFAFNQIESKSFALSGIVPLQDISYSAQELWDPISPLVYLNETTSLAATLALHKGAILNQEIARDQVLFQGSSSAISFDKLQSIVSEDLIQRFYSESEIAEIETNMLRSKFSEGEENYTLTKEQENYINKKLIEIASIGRSQEYFKYASENLTNYYLMLIRYEFNEEEYLRAIDFAQTQSNLLNSKTTPKIDKKSIDKGLIKFLKKYNNEFNNHLSTKAKATEYFYRNIAGARVYNKRNDLGEMVIFADDKINFLRLAQTPEPKWALGEISELSGLFVDFMIEDIAMKFLNNPLLQALGGDDIQNQLNALRSNKEKELSNSFKNSIPKELEGSAANLLLHIYAVKWFGKSTKLLYENSDELVRKSESVKKRLYSEFPDLIYSSKKSQYALNSSSIARNLSDEESLVEFFRYETPKDKGSFGIDMEMKYGAIIIDTSHELRLVKDLDKERIDNLILKTKGFLREGGKGNDEPLAENLKEIHNLLWKPINQKLDPKTKKVFISSSDQLNNLSFSILINQDDKFLAETIEVHMINSSSEIIKNELVESRRGDEGKSIYVFSHPLYFNENENDFPALRGIIRNALEELPQTENESKEILKYSASDPLIRAVEFINEFATEKTLKSLKNPDILHIASHGIQLDMPNNALSLSLVKYVDFSMIGLSSGIALTNAGETFTAWGNGNIHDFESDGWLSVYEIRRLNLKDTQLVFLSACDTGISSKIIEGEGALSIARAFKRAGAKNVVYTLWPVDDEKSREFSYAFYEKLLKEDQDVSKAFSSTQKELLVKEKEEHGLGTAAKLFGCFTHSIRR